MHAHFPGNVRQNPVPIVQLDPKHGVGERLRDRPLNFDDVFLRHLELLCSSLEKTRPSASPCYNADRILGGPLGWIATVCSKWAEKLPSFVTAVHRSSRMRTALPPILIIGSIASTMPT